MLRFARRSLVNLVLERSMLRRLTILLLLALPCATLAQTDLAPQPAKEKAAKDKKVCRRDVATGSIMSHATCLTPDVWAAIDAQNAATTQRQSDQNHRSAVSNRFNGAQ
jgi:hypothetical protein